jgi:hypothetical protein
VTRAEAIEYLLKHGCLPERPAPDDVKYLNADKTRWVTIPRKQKIYAVTMRAVCDFLGIPSPPELTAQQKESRAKPRAPRGKHRG